MINRFIVLIVICLVLVFSCSGYAGTKELEEELVAESMRIEPPIKSSPPSTTSPSAKKEPQKKMTKSSAKTKKSISLTKEEEAGVKLLLLVNKGLLRTTTSSGVAFLKIEPSLWRAMLHVEKEHFCQTAGSFYRKASEKEGTPIQLLIIQDMTTGDKLAYADIYTKQIEAHIER